MFLLFLYVYLGPEVNSFFRFYYPLKKRKRLKKISNKIINDIYNIEDQFVVK